MLCSVKVRVKCLNTEDERIGINNQMIATIRISHILLQALILCVSFNHFIHLFSGHFYTPGNLINATVKTLRSI
jgi:hypothetical protein